MLKRRPIPRWLAIPWWWLLVGNVIETAICSAFRVDSGSLLSTGTWFLTGWGLLQAWWLWQADSRSRALFWYAADAIADLFVLWFDWIDRRHPGHHFALASMIVFCASVACVVIGILVFRRDLTRYSLEAEGVDPELSWWMSVMFSTFYFQYQFHLTTTYQAVEQEA